VRKSYGPDGTEYHDYPLQEIADSMTKQMARGATCYQKWTCGQCHERVTMGVPDLVFEQCHHDEPHCGFTTDVREQGCNFMFILAAGRTV
jgi:hypothetical protein